MIDYRFHMQRYLHFKGTPDYHGTCSKLNTMFFIEVYLCKNLKGLSYNNIPDVIRLQLLNKPALP